MADALIPIGDIAQHIIDLQRELRKLRNELRTSTKNFELGATETPQDSGGQIPAAIADYKTPVTLITSIIDTTTVLVKRQIPDAGSAGWADDPQLTTQLEVKLAPGLATPEVGDFISPLFTGVYQQVTAGTTINLPRYGLFNVSSAKFRAKVKAESDNTIDVALIDEAGTEVSTLTAAKADYLRRTFYDAQTINGVTYAYVGAAERTATIASSMITEKITPPYVVDTSIVLVERLGYGTGVTSVVWQDTTPRLWAEEPE